MVAGRLRSKRPLSKPFAVGQLDLRCLGRYRAQNVLRQAQPGQRHRQGRTPAIPEERAAEKSRSPTRSQFLRAVCQLAQLVLCCCCRRLSLACSSSETTVLPAIQWPHHCEHHALSSALLLLGARRGPYLVVEAGVVGDQGIADGSPISRRSHQWQLVCAALVHHGVSLSPLLAERQTLSYTAVCACSCLQVRRKCLSLLLAYARPLG